MAISRASKTRGKLSIRLFVQHTRNRMPIFNSEQFWPIARIAHPVLCHFTSRMKRTPLQLRIGIGHGPHDRLQPRLSRPAHSRDRLHQRLRIGVFGMFKNLLCRRVFHNAPHIHHRNLICHFCNHAQIVCNQHNRHKKFILQIAHQIQYLRLNGNIQCRRGFIGNQQ